MKVNDWVQIGCYALLAIATFAGPVVAARIARRDQRNAAPGDRAEGWYSRFLTSRWLLSPWILPPLLILNYVVQLIFDFRKTGPVTRALIFDIALDVAGVVWGGVLLVTTLIWRELKSRADSELALRRNISEVLREILDIQRDNINRHMEVHRLQAEIDRDIIDTLKETAPREIVGKALDIMESMNEEIEKVRQKSERRPGIADLFRR